MTTLALAKAATPLGTMHCAVHAGRLCALEFGDRWPRRLRWLAERVGGMTTRAESDPAHVVSRLLRYFAGELDALDGVALELIGTPFQRRVWTALRAVPAGRTVSYGELARTVCGPAAARAVGAANGANPIAIAVPCHRVIGADGGLTGYAGGIERKRWLLAHEAAQRRAPAACAIRGADGFAPRPRDAAGT
jgi:methylated-DNA-[protein]-cysteine S-methyltransferase